MGDNPPDAQYKTAQQSISARTWFRPGSLQVDGRQRQRRLQWPASQRSRSVATAKLEATRGNSEQHRQDVRIAEANAAFAIANEKCDDLAGNAQDVCRKEAKSAAVAAKSDAERVKTTAAANTIASEASVRSRARRLRPRSVTPLTQLPRKSAARSADDAKAACIKEAKVRHGQS